MKKFKSLIAAVVLIVSSLLAIASPQIANAAAPYTCTWNGGSSGNFSTAGNWTGCNSAAPQPGDGDNLVFPNGSLSSNASINNDITSLTAGTITFSGSGSDSFTLTGNTITVAGGIANSSTSFPTIDLGLTLSAAQSITSSSNYGVNLGDAHTAPTLSLGSHNLTIGSGTDTPSVFLYDTITGTGSLNALNGSGVYVETANSGWTGNTAVASGAQVYSYSGTAFGTSGSTITITSGGLLSFCGLNGATVAQAITVGGTGAGGSGAIDSNVACNQSSSNPDSYANVTLSGAVTLTSNTTVGSAGAMTLTGPLSGGFTITPITGMTGTLVISSSNNTSSTPNGTNSAPVTTTTYSDNSPSTTINIQNNVTGIVDGTYGDTFVSAGGTLKGDGTVGAMEVAKGGTVAPGHSPGCLTATGNLTEGGTYQAEIGGTTACSGYDQIIVNGTVTLDDGLSPATQGILQVSLVNGFKPAAGQTFEIINNKGTGAVTDTFANMPEGTTFTVSGYVFKISYKGGDGNDVVLTVVSVPSTPDTGFTLVKNNPILSMALILGAAGGLAIIARRKKVATVPVRASRKK